MQRSMLVVGLFSLVLGAVLAAYTIFAIVTGEVMLSGRTGDTAIMWTSAPGPYLVGLLIYGLGSLLMIWIAKGLLWDRPSNGKG